VIGKRAIVRTSSATGASATEAIDLPQIQILVARREHSRKAFISRADGPSLHRTRLNDTAPVQRASSGLRVPRAVVHRPAAARHHAARRAALTTRRGPPARRRRSCPRRRRRSARRRRRRFRCRARRRRTPARRCRPARGGVSACTRPLTGDGGGTGTGGLWTDGEDGTGEDARLRRPSARRRPGSPRRRAPRCPPCAPSSPRRGPRRARRRRPARRVSMARVKIRINWTSKGGWRGEGGTGGGCGGRLERAGCAPCRPSSARRCPGSPRRRARRSPPCAPSSPRRGQTRDLPRCMSDRRARGRMEDGRGAGVCAVIGAARRLHGKEARETAGSEERTDVAALVLEQRAAREARGARGERVHHRVVLLVRRGLLLLVLLRLAAVVPALLPAVPLLLPAIRLLPAVRLLLAPVALLATIPLLLLPAPVALLLPAVPAAAAAAALRALPRALARALVHIEPAAVGRVPLRAPAGREPRVRVVLVVPRGRAVAGLRAGVPARAAAAAAVGGLAAAVGLLAAAVGLLLLAGVAALTAAAAAAVGLLAAVAALVVTALLAAAVAALLLLLLAAAAHLLREKLLRHVLDEIHDRKRAKGEARG
jgi:hypothetical protein